MIRTGMRGIIELIRKHPKICRSLRCESPYFHHCRLLEPDCPDPGSTASELYRTITISFSPLLSGVTFQFFCELGLPPVPAERR